MLKGSIKASVEDSVETLQSDSLKEAGTSDDNDDDDDDPKVRRGEGVWYVKGEREFAVTKERKPRSPRYACARVCVCGGARAREYIRRRRRENERDSKRERARGPLFHLSPADAAFLSVIVPLTRPAATPGDPL